MISPPSLLPISMASLDFPVPVEPKITTRGKRRTPAMPVAILDTTERAWYGEWDKIRGVLGQTVLH